MQKHCSTDHENLNELRNVVLPDAHDEALVIEHVLKWEFHSVLTSQWRAHQRTV